MATFISDSAEWDTIATLWADTAIADKIDEIANVITSINATLQGVGLSDISQVSSASVRTQFNSMSKTCKEVHIKAEEAICEPFAYNLAKAADQASAINPHEFRISSVGIGGFPFSLVGLVSQLPLLDTDLKKSFEASVKKVGALKPSMDLQQAILDALMRKYRGKTQGSQIENEADIELLLKYYELLYPHDVEFFENASRLSQTTGSYDSEMEAVTAVAAGMQEMTDRYNREVSVIIFVVTDTQMLDGKPVTTTKYVTGEMVLGLESNDTLGYQDNVVPATACMALLNFSYTLATSLPNPFVSSPQIKMILVHTHPNHGRTHWDNVFSGDPEHPATGMGDATVPLLPCYESIYLVAPEGSLKKYEGKGTGANQANTKTELQNLPPVSTDIPKSTTTYLIDPKTGKTFPVAADY